MFPWQYANGFILFGRNYAIRKKWIITGFSWTDVIECWL